MLDVCVIYTMQQLNDAWTMQKVTGDGFLDPIACRDFVFLFLFSFLKKKAGRRD